MSLPGFLSLRSLSRQLNPHSQPAWSYPTDDLQQRSFTTTPSSRKRKCRETVDLPNGQCVMSPKEDRHNGMELSANVEQMDSFTRIVSRSGRRRQNLWKLDGKPSHAEDQSSLGKSAFIDTIDIEWGFPSLQRISHEVSQ